MPRACSVCANPECHVINSLIRDSTVTLREIGRKYSISVTSIMRHRDKCLNLKPSDVIRVVDNPDQLPELKHVADLPVRRSLTPTLLDELLDIRDGCLEIKAAAMQGKQDDEGAYIVRPDMNLALACLKEQHAVAHTLAKLALINHRHKEKAEEKAGPPVELTELVESILA